MDLVAVKVRIAKCSVTSIYLAIVFLSPWTGIWGVSRTPVGVPMCVCVNVV